MSDEIREYCAEELFNIWRERSKDYKKKHDKLLREVKKSIEYEEIRKNIEELEKCALLEKRRKRAFTKEKVRDVLKPLRIVNDDIWEQFQEKQAEERKELINKTKQKEGEVKTK